MIFATSRIFTASIKLQLSGLVKRDNTSRTKQWFSFYSMLSAIRVPGFKAMTWKGDIVIPKSLNTETQILLRIICSQILDTCSFVVHTEIRLNAIVLLAKRNL